MPNIDLVEVEDLDRRECLMNSRLWDHEKQLMMLESSMNMLYADYVDAGQMPVVLANKFGGVIFHEACGHLLETTQIERGTTPFENKLNEKVAHESVTAIDEGISEDPLVHYQ